MKLFFAAPASFFPALPTAAASQHFLMEPVFGAPDSGLPFFPTALAAQLSCAIAGPSVKADNSIAMKSRFIVLPPRITQAVADLPRLDAQTRAGRNIAMGPPAPLPPFPVCSECSRRSSVAECR